MQALTTAEGGRKQGCSILHNSLFLYWAWILIFGGTLPPSLLLQIICNHKHKLGYRPDDLVQLTEGRTGRLVPI